MACHPVRVGAITALCVIISSGHVSLGDVPSPAQVMDQMSAFDKVVLTGMTATGTQTKYPNQEQPLTPTMTLDLSFTVSGSARALHLRATGDVVPIVDRVPPPPAPDKVNAWGGVENGLQPGQDGKLVLMILHTAIAFFDDKMSANFVSNKTFPVNADGTFGTPFFARAVNISRPHSSDWTLAPKMVFWSLGRGYTEFFKEIKSVEVLNGNRLLVTARGFESPANQGLWILEVEPANAYLVRRAEFFPRTDERPVDRDPQFAISNSGLIRAEGFAYPTSAESTVNLGIDSQRDDFEFQTVSHKFDEDLHEAARRQIQDPDAPYTFIMDTRGNEPIVSEIDPSGNPRRFGGGAAGAGSAFSMRSLLLILNVVVAVLLLIVWAAKRRSFSRKETNHDR